MEKCPNGSGSKRRKKKRAGPPKSWERKKGGGIYHGLNPEKRQEGGL